MGIKYLNYYLKNNCGKSIRKISLKLIDNLISAGVDKDSRNLGTHYVLGSLTLVSYAAACALPWMYESFRYNN